MTMQTAAPAPAVTGAGGTLAIEAHDLVKTYPKGVRALDGLSSRSPAGTVFALLGPNGAGKSTTVKILTTLAQADSGTAMVAAFVAAMSVASASTASAFESQFLAAASSVSRLRPVIVTFAPSATNSRAVASPMPLLPPVINAVLFANLIVISSSCIIKLRCHVDGLVL